MSVLTVFRGPHLPLYLIAGGFPLSCSSAGYSAKSRISRIIIFIDIYAVGHTAQVVTLFGAQKETETRDNAQNRRETSPFSANSAKSKRGIVRQQGSFSFHQRGSGQKPELFRLFCFLSVWAPSLGKASDRYGYF